MKTRLRIKELAKEQGLSMTKLHQRSEVAYGTIRKIFRDPFTVVNSDTLTRLAETLRVPIQELVESVPDAPDNPPMP